MSRHKFDSVTPRADVISPARIGPLRFTVLAVNGEVDIDFTMLRGTRLERDVVLAFQQSLTRLRVDKGQVSHTKRALIMFLSDLAARHPELVRTEDLSADLLHAWVLQTMPQGPASGWSAYDKCMDVFHVLKALPEHALSGPVKERLLYIHPLGPPVRIPRNSYSSHVIDQLTAACRKQIPEIVKRLTGDADRLIERGTDPRGQDTHAWCNAANVAWLANQVGPLSNSHSGAPANTTLRHHGGDSLPSVSARIFPAARDLAPFFVLLALETGWTPAEIMDVRTDCQSNRTKDYVTLTTTKYRAGHKRHSERFRASGYFSPGGLVAQLLAITERLRQFTELPFVFIATWNRSGKRVVQPKFRAAERETLSIFCEEIGLTDEDGLPVRYIEPARLRKTHKERWYKKTHGQIDRFAREDHSRAVAAENYGNIPALEDTHDTTIEDAQRAAMQAAMRPRVTPSTDISTVAEEVGVASRDAQDLASGARDMWVSGCLDVRASPFGKMGELCPSRPGTCLECNNAVVLGRHLPRILAYQAWLDTQRETMGEADWTLLHGAGYANIQQVILPRFPATMVAQAQAMVESGDEPLLPPSLILEGVV